MKDSLERDGFAMVVDVLGKDDLTKLPGALDDQAVALLARGGATYGGRNILDVAAIRALAKSPPIRALVEPLLGAAAKAVRGIFFDKTPQANWPVVWHQDLTLALACREEIAGWGNWSVKAGVVHAQPPVAILERMVTLRIQIDDCDEDNGPLRVLAGSHRLGRLSADGITQLRKDIPEHVCCVPAGGVFIMRPLLLHASSPARKPRHRRVVHLEFAPGDLLPPELDWAFAA